MTIDNSYKFAWPAPDSRELASIKSMAHYLLPTTPSSVLLKIATHGLYSKSDGSVGWSIKPPDASRLLLPKKEDIADLGGDDGYSVSAVIKPMTHLKGLLGYHAAVRLAGPDGKRIVWGYCDDGIVKEIYEHYVFHGHASEFLIAQGKNAYDVAQRFLESARESPVWKGENYNLTALFIHDGSEKVCYSLVRELQSLYQDISDGKELQQEFEGISQDIINTFSFSDNVLSQTFYGDSADIINKYNSENAMSYAEVATIIDIANYFAQLSKESIASQSDWSDTPSSDTTWMDLLTPDERAQLMTADADGTVVPSAETIAELRMVAEARMAEQTANLDKTIGETNIVGPTGDGTLNLPEGWEQADYEWIQAVLAAQKDGDASAAAEQANLKYQEYNSAMVSAGNSAYGVYNAALSGDGLALAQNTVNLVTSIDQAVDSYLKLEGGGDGGFLTKEMGQELGKVGAGLNFAGDLIELTESIGSGDADETHEIIDYRLAA